MAQLHTDIARAQDLCPSHLPPARGYPTKGPPTLPVPWHRPFAVPWAALLRRMIDRQGCRATLLPCHAACQCARRRTAQPRLVCCRPQRGKWRMGKPSQERCDIHCLSIGL